MLSNLEKGFLQFSIDVVETMKYRFACIESMSALGAVICREFLAMSPDAQASFGESEFPMWLRTERRLDAIYRRIAELAKLVEYSDLQKTLATGETVDLGKFGASGIKRP